MLLLISARLVFKIDNNPAQILDGTARISADADENAIPMERLEVGVMSILPVSVRMIDSLGRDTVSFIHNRHDSSTCISDVIRDTIGVEALLAAGEDAAVLCKNRDAGETSLRFRILLPL